MAVSTSSFEAVFIKSTNAAHVEADALDGAQNVSIDRSNTMVDVTHQGQQFVRSVPTTTTISLSVDGVIDPASLPYGVLKAAFESRAVTYLTVIEDSSAAEGDEQGKRYPVYVESLNFSYATGDVLKFDASFSLAGDPVSYETPAP